MVTRTLLAFALCAMRIAAQSTTTISMFLNMEDSHPTPIITASIVRADATATTYVANCAYDDDSEHCAMTDQTVTTGASWQEFASSGPDGSYRMSCTFTGTTDGECHFTQSAAEGGSVYIDSLVYAEATNPFPGFMQVLVTGGVDKLSSASSSGPEETGASSSSATTSAAEGQATNGAKAVLPSTLRCILALLVIPGMLYL